MGADVEVREPKELRETFRREAQGFDRFACMLYSILGDIISLCLQPTTISSNLHFNKLPTQTHWWDYLPHSVITPASASCKHRKQWDSLKDWRGKLSAWSAFPAMTIMFYKFISLN